MVNPPKYILVVDDNSGVRQLLCELLKNEGYNVEAVENGLDALESVKKNTPDLIILDLKMPKMNGLTTLKRLKEIDPEIPIIMMTAFSDLDTVRSAKEENLVRHYIGKPFDLKEMHDLVKEAMKG
jgi:two-component system response regulator (stage 0 sporulation protein F)